MAWLGMYLAELLRSKRNIIIDRWLDAVVATYPSESSEHLLNQKDQFHNPVGTVLRRDLPVLWDALLGEPTEFDSVQAIAEIMRIRTVQCPLPSQAVAWVFALKKIVRDQLESSQSDKFGAELSELDSRIDGLALQLCDEYMTCQETISEIRVREAQRRSAKLVEQVNKLYGGVEESRDVD